MSQAAPHLARLRDFVGAVGGLVESLGEEAPLLALARPLLADLVAHDDWLPDEYAEPDPRRYRQYLLHCDSRQRFSVVSFVWGPGQATPIHDHTVWGLVGVLRGAELSQRFVRAPGGLAAPEPPRRLEPGAVEAVSPAVGDIHRVANAHDDRTSISIHLYGANIGAVRRHAFDDLGRPRTFVSGYANDALPNLWRTSETLP